MRLTKWRVLSTVCGLMVLTGTALALADSMVEVSGVHLCCPACLKGVAKALEPIEGVTQKCNQDAGTVTITAKDDVTAQKALDALSAAGFHGKTSSPTLTIKDNPDPLKVDPVAVVIDGCVGCGLCGANAHAATLCPSFYRAEVVQNPKWHERLLHSLRGAVVRALQPA